MKDVFKVKTKHSTQETHIYSMQMLATFTSCVELFYWVMVKCCSWYPDWSWSIQAFYFSVGIFTLASTAGTSRL